MHCSCKNLRIQRPAVTCPGCGQVHRSCHRIDRFDHRQYLLGEYQLRKIANIARRIIRQPGKLQLMLTAYLDAQELRQQRFSLARYRLQQVSRRLLTQLEQLQPGIGRRLRIRRTVSRSFNPVATDQSRNRRIEVCFTALYPAQAQPAGALPPRRQIAKWDILVRVAQNELQQEGLTSAFTERKVAAYRKMVADCLRRYGSQLTGQARVFELPNQELLLQLEAAAGPTNKNIGDRYRDQLGEILRQCFAKSGLQVQVEAKGQPLTRRMRRFKTPRYLDIQVSSRQQRPLFAVEAKWGTGRVSKSQQQKDDYMKNHQRFPTVYVHGRKP